MEGFNSARNISSNIIMGYYGPLQQGGDSGVDHVEAGNDQYEVQAGTKST